MARRIATTNVGPQQATGQANNVSASVTAPGSCNSPSKSWMDSFVGFFKVGGPDKSVFQIICGFIAITLLMWCVYFSGKLVNGEIVNMPMFICFALASLLTCGTYIGGEPYIPAVLAGIFVLSGMFTHYTGTTFAELIHQGQIVIGTVDSRNKYNISKKQLESAVLEGKSKIMSVAAEQIVYVIGEDYGGLETGQECIMIDRVSDKKGYMWVKPGEKGVYEKPEVLVPAVRLKERNIAIDIGVNDLERPVEKKVLNAPQQSAKIDSVTIYKNYGYGEHRFSIPAMGETEGIEVSGNKKRYDFDSDSRDYVIRYDDGVEISASQDILPHRDKARFKIVSKTSNDISITMSIAKI